MRRNLLFLSVVISVFSICFSSETRAEDIDKKGRLYLGLNYYGVSVQYGLTPKIVVEGKYQTGEGTTITGGRLYCFRSKMSEKFTTYFGAEIDMISFEGEVSKGEGIALEAFIGGEYLLRDKTNLGLDIGPALISLSDSDTGESIAKVEFVVNISINFLIR